MRTFFSFFELKAYVAAQSGGNLWVVKLSNLSGTYAHGPDSNPLSANDDYIDRGKTNLGHTLSIGNGLLLTALSL